MIQKTMFPQPDFARENWLNLNGTWEFSYDAPVYDSTIEVPYPWGSPLSGTADNDKQQGFYRRSVSWDPKEEKIFLCFGAVDYTCEVSVNGTAAGTHTGGYDRFDLDVTALWNRSAENVITVSCTDTGADNQLYGKQGYGNARGIWQTVWLEARPAAYIGAFFVKTRLSGEVTYEIDTVNAENGAVVKACFGDHTACAEVQDNKACLTLAIEDPALWTPDEPNLYEGTLTLGSDTVSTYFGIREIGTGKFGEHDRNYVTLNGKPYYLNGVLDQSFNPKGYFTLPSDADCKEEILRLKRIGINMARIHIKAEEPLKLYYADKCGLLIMEDIPCFWGEPLPDTRAQYEKEMEAEIRRDRNHPSIFYWVIFNETWGLFNIEKLPDGTEKKTYTQETADWVVSCCNKARALDPTRLIEDNSVCNRDHTVTDVNTWHFYSNGYERVKKVVDDFCETAYPGTQENYKEGYVMADVPCMNSECGAVWGVEGNAGESDISWEYKYMLNEFRRHDKLCGFVFTEFHDVVNEFNGYYKIDNTDKDFGYSAFGMNIKDLHAQDYVGADFAPMTTVQPGETVTVPLFGSSFTDERHGKTLTVAWELTCCDPTLSDETFMTDCGEFDVLWGGYGTKELGSVETTMPELSGPAVLSWTLCDGDEQIIKNCIFFDIDLQDPAILSVEPAEFKAEGFEVSRTVQEGNKVFGLKSGSFTKEIQTKDIPGLSYADDLTILFEAATREPMTHDYPEDTAKNEKIDLNYMLGYRCDPGENRNSFKQTDEVSFPGTVDVLLNGECIGTFQLPDDPADSRGLLSHHYQVVDNLFDEAGTYGYLCRLHVPSRVLLKLKEAEKFTLTFRTGSGNGLSLFGRKSGRYGIGVDFIAE